MRRFNLLCISLRRKPEAYIGSMLQSLPPWIFSSSDMARWECTGCEEGFLSPDWSESPKDNQTPRAYTSLQMTTRPQGHTYFVSVSFAFLTWNHGARLPEVGWLGSFHNCLPIAPASCLQCAILESSVRTAVWRPATSCTSSSARDCPRPRYQPQVLPDPRVPARGGSSTWATPAT